VVQFLRSGNTARSIDACEHGIEIAKRIEHSRFWNASCL
jgi:hypothetical protein